MEPLIIGNTQHHTEQSFWSAFLDDIRAAQSLIVIACPYVRSRRLKRLLPDFEALLKRGGQVCVILQDPTSWTASDEGDEEFATAEIGQQSLEDFNKLILELQSKKVHVLVRRFSHQKIVIIDGGLVWYGSLNVLSNTGKTHENMTRVECAVTAEWMADAHNLHCPQCKQQFEKPMKWFGQQFAKCRDADDLTQAQLAEILKTEQTHISKIEHGQRNLTLDKLVAYLNRMGWGIFFVPRALSNSAQNFDSSISVSRKSIGKDLKQSRLSQKLSRETVAKELGMTRQGLAKIEHGKSNPNVSTLLAIAEACGQVVILDSSATNTPFEHQPIMVI
jgi:transcriptional regulator with XRE-family HTH domain